MADEISLYLHIPYCDRLCWFCACHTKQTRHYEPVTAYLRSLHAEIATVAGLVSGKGHVRAVHFGGGSPTMLKPEDMVALGAVSAEQLRFSSRIPKSASRSIQTTWMRRALMRWPKSA